jgi:hypothetical protein
LTTLKYNAKVAIDKELLQMQILGFAGKSLYSDLNLKESHLIYFSFDTGEDIAEEKQNTIHYSKNKVA